MSASDWITLGIAILGAVLGILNTWRGWWKDRERLTVSAESFDFNGHDCASIEIINTGHVPVSVERAGFQLDGSDVDFVHPGNLIMGPKAQHNLGPGERTRFVGTPIFSGGSEFKSVKEAYCETGRGRRFTGDAKSLRTLAGSE